MCIRSTASIGKVRVGFEVSGLITPSAARISSRSENLVFARQYREKTFDCQVMLPAAQGSVKVKGMYISFFAMPLNKGL
jgi:hypothetical protein